MQKITPFLWFDDQAEEAANFYVSIFKNSRIKSISRYGEGGPSKPGSVMTVAFQLEGLDYLALNGGPHYKLTEAFSLMVNCATQAELDDYWDKLLVGGGEPSRCGWLKDKFGLSWQLVPAALPELLSDADPAASSRVMAAVMQMQKLDIEVMKKAHRGL
jgi:predicted 3-demethylubiquinone-9 3-methyltransferase (glyoxalase superfamily)